MSELVVCPLGDRCLGDGRKCFAAHDMTELAWAAGFFDGEGSSYATQTSTTRKKSYIHMTISQKGRETLDRFHAAVGAGTVTGPNKRGLYRWQVQSRAVHDVKDKLWPYLCNAKREQWLAAEAIAEQRST